MVTYKIQPPSSEADPKEKGILLSENQSYCETVRGVRSYMTWSFIPDHKYTSQSRHDNPWTGTRSQPVGKVSIALPPEDWFCKKNLNNERVHSHDSCSSGDRL